MFIIVEHKVLNQKVFWATVQGAKGKIPPSLTLHQMFPSEDGTNSICLWEAAKLEEVRDFVEGAVGEVSENIYFAIAEQNAIGLPGKVQA